MLQSKRIEPDVKRDQKRENEWKRNITAVPITAFLKALQKKNRLMKTVRERLTDYIPESITVPAFQKKRDKSIRSLMYFCI